jgi:S1-C subfamily serine protease
MSASFPTSRFTATQRGALLLAVSFFTSLASAQSSNTPTTRPLLDELNHETQSLFRDISPSIVRVQLPLPTDLAYRQDLFQKWANELDPQQLAKLAEMERRYPGTPYSTAEIRPTTNPSSTESTTQPTPSVFVLRLDHFNPNGIGIVFDSDNHLLIPRYVDKAACPYPIPVALGDGRWAMATFIASDALSDLTLLKLSPHVKTKPATLAPDKPAPGTLLLVMSLNPAANRLAVWEGWEPDTAAIVNTDGSVAGFTKANRFLSAGACSPLVADLIEHGTVHRPILGVFIQSVSLDDPERQLNPTLGTVAAFRIHDILPNSSAERAGLQESDLIISIAGQSVGDASNFAALIAERRGPTPLGIIRNGQTHIVNVDLELH